MDNPVGKEAAIEGSTNPDEENTAMDLWAAWQWVEHIRNLSVGARARAGYGLEEAEWMLVLAMLWTLPHSTVEELIELGYLGKSKIEGVLSAVDKRGWAGSKEMGHALGIRQRYFLLPNGKNEVMRYWGVPEEWQTGDDTLKLLHDSLPMVEVANDLLPRLWRTQAVRTPTVVAVGPKDEPHFATIDENTQLCRLIWVRAYRRSVHALAQYRNADGFRFWIAIVWQGYVCSADDKVAGLADFYNGFRTEPSGWYSEPATPAGVVYLVPDRLSGFHVTMTVAKGIPKAVVTAQGEVVEQLTPVSSPVGYLHPPLEQPNTRTVGTPFADWVREPERGAAYGEKPYMELREIGVNPRTIAKSGGTAIEAGDGLDGAEGAAFGSQGHGHPGGEPSVQAQGVQPGVHQGGEYLAQPRTPQGVDVLIPTAVLHVMQAVLNTPVLAEQFKQFLWSAAPGTQAGQQVPALPANLPSGYIHPLLLHHGPLPRPGEPQFIPDVAGQQVIGPDPPPLDHTRFFSRVSACGSPSSSGANPSVSAASTVG